MKHLVLSSIALTFAGSAFAQTLDIHPTDRCEVNFSAGDHFMTGDAMASNYLFPNSYKSPNNELAQTVLSVFFKAGEKVFEIPGFTGMDAEGNCLHLRTYSSADKHITFTFPDASLIEEINTLYTGQDLVSFVDQISIDYGVSIEVNFGAAEHYSFLIRELDKEQSPQPK